MRTILVAVDGSEPSFKGVQTAAEFAKALGLTLELVSVVPPVLLPPPTYAELIQKLENAGIEHANEVLARAAALAKNAGVESVGIVLHGAPAEAIADLAKSERVWGVVVGAKGHGALARVLLGSTADRLVHLATKPVLVVR